MKRLVSGIKPTGAPHLGNYIGMIRPALQLANAPSTRAFCFIADYHALNSTRDPALLGARTHEAAATFLALGLDPDRVTLYRQSDVPEIPELAAVLACVCPKGLMNRAHAYKAAVAGNAEKSDRDAGINMGLYTYPILMAADILALDADIVPVGEDQLQHIQIARDLTRRFERAFGPALTLPEAVCPKGARRNLPGTDGRKMSKSYKNTLPLFCSRDELGSRIARIRTDGAPAAAAKNPDESLLFAYYAEIAPASDVAQMRRAFARGIGYADIKARLFAAMDQHLAEPRRRYERLMAEPERVDAILSQGARAARAAATDVLARVKDAIGIGSRPRAAGSAPRALRASSRR